MRRYVVYELVDLFNGKKDLRKIDTVKATNSETAIRKALLGTQKEYKNMRAFEYSSRL